MGLIYSTDDASAQASFDSAEDVIKNLQKSDPELYERLMMQVDCNANQKTVLKEQAVSSELSVKSPDALSAAQPETPKLSDYVFPFENLVFEGGGSKGRIYLGALKCLEEAGIKAKRFAGASAGAMTAALMAINVPLDEVNKYVNQDLRSLLEDHSYGYFSILPNLLRYFGWNPAQKFLDFFGKILEDQTGNKDITFEEVHKKFGNELCIVAVNTNLQAAEYFHVKTYPTMPIRMAVRMSMAIPGFFAAVPYDNFHGKTDYYVDGGVICNYPIHAFDGWWLSLRPEDTFYRQLRPLSDIPKLMDRTKRFSPVNEKTLGFLVFSAEEDEILRLEFENRINCTHTSVPRPNTKLYRKQKRRSDWADKHRRLLAHKALTDATDKFFDALRDSDLQNGGDETITKSEFRAVFANVKDPSAADDKKFRQGDATLLFGENYDIDKIFDSIDISKDGVIDKAEMRSLVERTLTIHRRFVGYARRHISTLFDFGKALYASISRQSMNVYMTADDLERTVGLDTDYIGTLDFTLEDADAEFLAQQGYEITKKFLLKYAAEKGLEMRKKSGMELGASSARGSCSKD